uniref:Ovule protein n=1 Tax=Haemonchus placei TaxID=6290 RepID=A0A0N4W7Q0_HAEPC
LAYPTTHPRFLAQSPFSTRRIWVLAQRSRAVLVRHLLHGCCHLDSVDVRAVHASTIQSKLS